MSFNHDTAKDMFLANNPRRAGDSDVLSDDHSGQQLHVSGVFIILLEVVLVVENLFPILVVVLWLPPPARGVGDRLVAAFSVTCILSDCMIHHNCCVSTSFTEIIQALVPTPLGLASYFSGGWYGGAPTCTTYQVTSTWCNLSSLVLLTYICINCHIAVTRLVRLKPPDRCHSCQRSVLGSAITESNNTRIPVEQRQEYDEPSVPGNIGSRHRERGQHQIQSSVQHNGQPPKQHERNNHCNGDAKAQQNFSVGKTAPPIVLGYAENSLVDLDLENEVVNRDTTNLNVGKSTTQINGRAYTQTGEFPTGTCYPESSSPTDLDASNALLSGNSIKNGTNFQQISSSSEANYAEAATSRTNTCSSLDQHYGPESQSSILGAGECLTRDYVSLVLFFLFSMTLGVSSLPVAGLGPSGMPHDDTSCRSWLVPTPALSRERVFFITFLTLIYLCLSVGCATGISVCLQVSKRMKQERRRKTRLYHEEENVPDLGQLYALDCMRRHYSMTCIVMAGILTWVPSALMLTLQKAGVEVSEPTLMYSNIATSLPGLLNPLLYSLALARYRTGYKALIEKCCCKRRELKPHPMKKVHSTAESTPTATTNVEVTIDPDGQRHLCLHGTSNPTFNSELDQLLQVDEDEEIDDEDIDDDEDYCPEDSDSPDQDKDYDIVISPTGLSATANERTPLHAVSMATSGDGQSFRTVLANRPAGSHRHCKRESRNTKATDKEALLLSRSAVADDETGL